MFRRGFKTWCETIAVQRRQQLKLPPAAPLPAIALAADLGVVVRGAEEIPDLLPDTLPRLLQTDPQVWSALTIVAGDRHMVILNSSHSPARQASDLMHELAHMIIGHPPVLGLITDDGLLMLNCYDKDKEDEAAWLSGSLLLPREALLAIRRKGLNENQVMEIYSASPEMFRFRINVTGVDVHLRRYRGLQSNRAVRTKTGVG